MTNSQLNGTQTPLLPATASRSSVGDFPVGSAQSRAAARFLIEARGVMSGEGILLRSSVMANPASPGTRCGCKVPQTGQVAICKCFMPTAITEGLS